MDMQTWRDSHARATDAAEAFCAALAAVGLPESVMRGVRPVVTYKGRPCVELGVFPADVVERMAEAVRDAETSAR
jgi:hypothetical protein